MTVLLGCGGSQPAPAAPAPEAAPAPGGEAPAEAATPVPAAWSDSLSDKEKAEFMKAKVLPRMTEVFQAYDAKAYAEVSCKTCHGPEYKEPHDFLPPLTIKGGKMLEAEKKPELAKFMHDKVVPEMATIFGMKVYDPATKEGFGCARCHTMNMQ